MIDRFTVRVELHGAGDEEGMYTILHQAMEEENFLTHIISDDGIKFKLPRAEYNLIDNSLTREDVMAKAKSAASITVHNTNVEFSIIVTPSNGRLWHGLKRIKED